MAGIAVIASARWGHANLWPFALTLAASLCWGAGNVVGRRIGRVDPIAFIVWSSLVAPLPMLALSAATAPQATFAALLHPSVKLALCVAGLSYGGTLFSFGVWARLLAKYPAAAVAPFALLVPVVGMVTAALLFGEQASAGRTHRRGHRDDRARHQCLGRSAQRRLAPPRRLKPRLKRRLAIC